MALVNLIPKSPSNCHQPLDECEAGVGIVRENGAQDDGLGWAALDRIYRINRIGRDEGGLTY